MAPAMPPMSKVSGLCELLKWARRGGSSDIGSIKMRIEANWADVDVVVKRITTRVLLELGRTWLFEDDETFGGSFFVEDWARWL